MNHLKSQNFTDFSSIFATKKCRRAKLNEVACLGTDWRVNPKSRHYGREDWGQTRRTNPATGGALPEKSNAAADNNGHENHPPVITAHWPRLDGALHEGRVLRRPQEANPIKGTASFRPHYLVRPQFKSSSAISPPSAITAQATGKNKKV